MKKKLFVIVPVCAVFLLAILLIPLPGKEQSRQGAVKKAAILYKTVQWKESILSSEGETIYQATRTYGFPRNFADLETLWEEEKKNLPEVSPFVEYGETFRGRVLSVFESYDGFYIRVFGFDSNAPEFRYTFFLKISDAVKIDDNGTEISLSELKEGDTVAIGCSVNRTSSNSAWIEDVFRISRLSPAKNTGYLPGDVFLMGSYQREDILLSYRENADQAPVEGYADCPAFIIESEKELVALCGKLEATEYWGNDDESEISALPTAHGKAFFKQNVLVMVYVAEGSGSNITAFRCRQTEDSFTVIAEGISPEGGYTCDMSYRLLVIPVPKNQVFGRTLQAYRISR